LIHYNGIVSCRFERVGRLDFEGGETLLHPEKPRAALEKDSAMK
jgi:hypothetical protein